MRSGENALKVIERVRAKLIEIEPTLPPGVKVVTTYDRGVLIEGAIATVSDSLIEELIVVSVIIIIFLLHLTSAAIPIVTITVAVILSFIPMLGLDITANIMSLGGIAIAIGSMVDSSIVIVEQTHKKLEEWLAQGSPGDFKDVVISAAQEVGPPSFYGLLVIAIAFAPIFALEAQEGKLFKPLAFANIFAIVVAAVLSVTMVPAIVALLIRPQQFDFRPRWLCWLANKIITGKIYPEAKHPLSRFLHWLYQPMVEFVLRFRYAVVISAVLVVLLTIPIYLRLGTEFMPPLDEGVLLYMPSTMPGISVTEAQRLLQTQDKLIKSFPEVERVFGKAGRAETATDPAPFSMMETVVMLKPQNQWPKVKRWYSESAPEWLQKLLRLGWSDHQSTEELIYSPGGLNEKLQLPGVVNAWTMPIKARVDMLTTGIRTPVGIKVLGPDLTKIQELGQSLEMALKDVPGTTSVFAERTAGGYFLDFNLKREELARYGLTVDQANAVIISAVGGEGVTTTVEGRERYSVNVRYQRDYRSTLERLNRTLVPTINGAQVPLAQIADLKLLSGPGMIRDENGRLSGYVYVDVGGRDIGSYVADAKQAVKEKLQLPVGYTLVWSGQYENMERVAQKLLIMVPLSLFFIFLLMYFNTKSAAYTMIVLLSLPFSAAGSMWFLYLLDYNLSIPVWVGLIAFLGVDAETSVFMLLYLDLAYDKMKAAGRMKTKGDLREAILEGSVQRLRPKFMTVAVDFIGLMPVMVAVGAGADITKRIAAPMVAGMFFSFALELFVYPAIYAIWKWHTEVKKLAVAEPLLQGATG